MAVRKVTPTAAGVGKDTLIGTLIATVNKLSTKVNSMATKLDADAGVTAADFSTSGGGTQDTIAYRGINTPT